VFATRTRRFSCSCRARFRPFWARPAKRVLLRSFISDHRCVHSKYPGSVMNSCSWPFSGVPYNSSLRWAPDLDSRKTMLVRAGASLAVVCWIMALVCCDHHPSNDTAGANRGSEEEGEPLKVHTDFDGLRKYIRIPEGASACRWIVVRVPFGQEPSRLAVGPTDYETLAYVQLEASALRSLPLAPGDYGVPAADVSWGLPTRAAKELFPPSLFETLGPPVRDRVVVIGLDGPITMPRPRAPKRSSPADQRNCASQRDLPTRFSTTLRRGFAWQTIPRARAGLNTIPSAPALSRKSRNDLRFPCERIDVWWKSGGHWAAPLLGEAILFHGRTARAWFGDAPAVAPRPVPAPFAPAIMATLDATGLVVLAMSLVRRLRAAFLLRAR
jgi:hypothetical protein